MHRATSILLAFLLIVPVLGGCNKVQARAELKKGNSLYHQESYKQALQQFQKGLELDPEATFAWRSVGLTALALFRPEDPSPQNQEYSETAINAFKKYLADYPDDEKIQDYLMTMYVNAKKYDQALEFLEQQAQNSKNPNDPKFTASRVSILLKSNRAEEAWKLAQQLPPSPAKAEALYSIGVAAWDRSFHGMDIDLATREKFADMGLAATAEALRIRPDYFEAMVYYNLLYREKAKAQLDAAKRDEYIALAEQWQKKAIELRKKLLQQEKAKAKAAQEAGSAT